MPTTYLTKTTYTTKYYIGYYVNQKTYDKAHQKKTIYHQYVIDVGNTMKRLFTFSTTVGIE